jgi:alpha-tubulin suppressor-like RCC1 family protein
MYVRQFVSSVLPSFVALVAAAGCGSSESSDPQSSVKFSVLGADFSGNSVRICGSRPAADLKYGCANDLLDDNAECPCFDFNADGTLIVAGGAGAPAVSGLCPSIDLPPADWTFSYEIYSAPGCQGTQLNDGDHNFTCFDSHDLGTQAHPNQSVEPLVPGVNVNHVLCLTTDATKDWNFDTCSIISTPTDAAVGETRLDCGCTLVAAACDCGPGGVTPGDLESLCSFDPATCDIVCQAPAPQLLAWGLNNVGQVGDGCAVGGICPTPVPVLGLPPDDPVRTFVAGEEHSIVATVGGQVWTWGFNETGQLGDGTTTNRSAPFHVMGLPASPVLQVAGGYETSWVRTASGEVWAWGFNSDGELGNGTVTISSLLPVHATNLPASPVEKLASGNRHAIILTASGEVWTWGFNRYGQLGDGTTLSRSTAVRVLGLPVGDPVIDVVGGNQATHSLALTRSGHVWGWGGNSSGQLATASADTCAGVPCSTTAVEAQGLPAGDPVIALATNSYVSSGDGFVLALTRSGQVWAWGDNGSGQLGVASTDTCNGLPCSRTPIHIQGLPVGDRVVAVAAGTGWSFAITASGQLWAWGTNTFGRFGNGTTDSSPVPIMIPMPGRVTAIAASAVHSLATIQ